MRIEIWSDIACPWCFIGKVRFEKALRQYEHAGDVEVVWRSFQLQPDAPKTNAPSTVEHLMLRYGRSQAQVIEMMRGVSEAAASEGLAFQLDKGVACNTFDAHRLSKLGQAAGLGQVVMERLMNAYQCEGANVAEEETLVSLGVEAGLDESAVRIMLAGDYLAADVEADLERGRAFGVSGVPFFVIDEQHGVSGAQPTEFFLAALRQLGPQRPVLNMLNSAPAADGGSAADTLAAACDGDGCELPRA